MLSSTTARLTGRSTRRRVTRSLAALGVTGLLLSGAACSRTPAPQAPTTATVTRAEVTAGVTATGALAAASSETLGFAKGGRLTSVRVEVGDRVDKGDVLAVVDRRAARTALRQAEASLNAQGAALDKLNASPAVEAAQRTLDQAGTIVSATRHQVAATVAADGAAITRARTQRRVDGHAEDEAREAVRTLRTACHATVPDPAACTALATAETGLAGAQQKLVADQTAIVAAKQKQHVDAAAGRTTVATAEQSAVAARNALVAAQADRPHSLDQQSAVIAAARAAVDAAEKDLADTVLRAPAAGTVAALNGTRGEYVAASSGTTTLAPGSSAAVPGSTASAAAKPFLVLSNVAKLRLVLPFEESDAAQIRAGQPVSVLLDALPDTEVSGTVDSVSPSATATSGVISYYATIALDHIDKRMRDGQTGRATVVTVDRPDVLSVPNSAVHRQGAQSTVIVLGPDNSQQVVPFQPGVVGAERTEVISGLTEGQQIVLPTTAS